MNDINRGKYVLNDEGLYDLQRRSRMSMKKWVRENRQLIDECISGKKPAHYLKYGLGYMENRRGF